MEKITQFAMANSRLTMLFLLVVIVSGIVTFRTMPSREDPEITIRTAQVAAHFPGMSTTLMENLIARPLERKIRELAELKEIKTTVKTGTTLIEVSVQDSYFDLDPIWQDLRDKMEDMKMELPSGTIGPTVNDDFGRVAAATIALYGRGYEMRELRDVAHNLRDKISTLRGVGRVELHGVQDERVYLEFNATRLAFYGINPGNIVSAITQQNVVLPGGSIAAGNKRITIEPGGNLGSIEELQNVQVGIPGTEQTVYLRDIVDVRRAYQEPSKNPVFYNNREAVILAVSAVPRYNIEEFGQEVMTKVHKLQQQLPVGLQLEFATYQPELVKKAVADAVNNLYQTIAVVLAVVLIFLGIRTGLIVGAIVPLTILASLVAMNIWGVELHRMSIAAIIIALGLLVDNGIVIAEDISRRMDAGAARKQAAVQAAGSLGFPLLVSSLTTILAFVPLMLAEDVIGEYLGALGQVMVTTLLASWFLALFATPVLCCWFLKENTRVQEQQSYQGAGYNLYRTMLHWILRYRLLFIAVMVLLLIVSVAALGKVPTQMMPYSSRNQILVYVDLPAGSDISHTVGTTRKLTSWLADAKLNPEITGHIAYIGYGGPRFFLALSPPDPGDNVAFMVVNTESVEDVRPVMARINRFMLEEMPEVNGRAKQMWLGGKEIGIVEYRIRGPDAGELYSYAYQIEKAFREIPGTTGVLNDWHNPVVRIQVDIDQARARRAGVSSETIARGLSSYYDGYEISDYREADKTIPIVLRGGTERDRLSELITLPMLSDTGKPVPLVQVADFSSVIEPDRLVREDQQRTITVSAKHDWLQAAQLHQMMLPAIDDLRLPEGYSIESGGEVESAAEANSALFINVPIALMGIALLLIWQFNSIRRPLIILLTIPLVITGAAFGLLAMDAFMSFTATLGLLSLAGIIINNGIVLIDRIDIERKNKNVRDAVMAACMARVRPILMTTLTTILGLIPLLLFGGALWYPMAVVIIFGLAAGSILTLGFIPVLYTMLFSSNLSPEGYPNLSGDPEGGRSASLSSTA